jgi:hypothetical protein
MVENSQLNKKLMKTETTKISLRSFLNEEGLKFFEEEIQLRKVQIAEKGILAKPKPKPCTCPSPLEDPNCFCFRTPSGRCICL